MHHSLIRGFIASAVNNSAGIALPVKPFLKNTFDGVFVLYKSANHEAWTEKPDGSLRLLRLADSHALPVYYIEVPAFRICQKGVNVIGLKIEVMPADLGSIAAGVEFAVEPLRADGET